MTIMWKEIMEQPEALRRCREVNAPVIRKLVEEIRSRDIQNILLAARGTSDHAALYGTYLLELTLGIPVSLAAPSIFTLYNHTMKLDKTLVIGLSQSGQAADALAVLEAGNKAGAITAAITNVAESPMALCAQHSLLCSAGPETSLAATKTFTCQLMLMAMLAAELAGNKDLDALLATVPDKVAALLSNTAPIEALATRYRFMGECFVLARGMNYAIAREAALKTQETCYVRAMGYATSDFYHGPMAMTEPTVPVIVFAPDGPSLANTSELIDLLRERENDVLVVSDLPEICAKGSVSIAIPSTGTQDPVFKDAISPFLNVVAAQVFACSLSVSKGLNPDVSRHLKKVTITR